ncbi:MAG TPA: hypothetical protein VEG39_20345 [Clostridia bacterium]|nr:hypothetical protein [Clostridia bacterium]
MALEKNIYSADTAQELVFKALADSGRRKILEILRDNEAININTLCSYFPTSRFAVMKNVNILEKAGLLTYTRAGNSKILKLNPESLRKVKEEWFSQF